MRALAPASMAPVVGLLSMGGPSAIVGRISGVVVDAIQCASLRAWSHVGKEVLESLPALTNGDTAAPILGIGRVGWIQTAATHLDPCAVFGWPASVVSRRHSVTSAPSYEQFNREASATSGVSGTKSGPRNKFFRAAFALAKPHNLLVSLEKCAIGSAVEHKQSAESLTGKIILNSLHGHILSAKAPPKPWKSGAAKIEDVRAMTSIVNAYRVEHTSHVRDAQPRSGNPRRRGDRASR